MQEKGAVFYVYIIIAIIFLCMHWFIRDNSKTELHCTGQTCEIKEYGEDKKLKSTSTIQAHICKDFEIHQQPNLIKWRKREYSVNCIMGDGRRFVLFKNHVKDYSKAQNALQELSSKFMLKDVYLDYTYGEKY